MFPALISHYPSPGSVGGRLIRQMVATLQKAGVQLPITSDILIACSGGSDSVALAHIMARYGRRVGTQGQITLLHVNHGWRGGESDQDAQWVLELGKKLGVAARIELLNTPAMGSDSWEETARTGRKAIFERISQEKNGIVLTAHQADDVAETVLWRILTGAASTHGGGIAVRHGVEVRPVIAVRKEELRNYLIEEGQKWREDLTNSEGRFMRSQMRRDLMPALERIFPKGINHLCSLAQQAQEAGIYGDEGSPLSNAPSVIASFFGAVGLKLRRGHWDALNHQAEPGALKDKMETELYLPKGWRVKCDRKKGKRRWVIQCED